MYDKYETILFFIYPCYNITYTTVEKFSAWHDGVKNRNGMRRDLLLLSAGGIPKTYGEVPKRAPSLIFVTSILYR